MTRFLNDREYLTGRAQHSQRLLPQEYPIQLDPADFLGAWVVTESGAMHYSTGEEWLAAGPPRMELMIPPWAGVPEGWFRTGIMAPSPLEDREIITNVFDFNYLLGRMVARFQPALGNMWIDAAQGTVVANSGDLVGYVTDLSGSGNDAIQAVSANRPAYEVYPVGHPQEGKAYFNFDGSGNSLDIPFAAPVNGTLIIATEWGSYAAGYTAFGPISIGMEERADIYEVFFFSDALSIIETDGLRAMMAQDSQHPFDRFAERTNWDHGFTDMSFLTSGPDVDLSSATTARNLFSGCSSIRDIPAYSMPNVGVMFEAFQDCAALAPFPIINFPACTDFRRTWSGCASLTAFPEIDMSAATNVFEAWDKCVALEAFPLIDLPNCTNFWRAWKRCSNMRRFANIDVSAGEKFDSAWEKSGLRTLPLLNFSSAAVSFERAWEYATGLLNVPAGVFDNVSAGNFTRAFVDNILTEASVDNILTSIATAAAGQNISNGTLDIIGGTSAPPSGAGQAAIDALRARGWVITVNGGY